MLYVRLAVLAMVCLCGGVGAQELRWFHAPGWYPLTMKNESSGAIYGASSEIMERLAARLHTTAVFQDVPWKRGFFMLDHGTADICAGAYDNVERKSAYIYTVPVFKNETRIFVLKNKSFSFASLSDLNGKRLGKPLGASYGAAFDEYAKNNIQLTENAAGAEKLAAMLMADRLDGFLGDFFDTQQMLRLRGLQERIVPLPKPVNTLDVFFMVSKHSPWSARAGLIQAEIKTMVDTGEIARILKNY